MDKQAAPHEVAVPTLKIIFLQWTKTARVWEKVEKTYRCCYPFPAMQTHKKRRGKKSLLLVNISKGKKHIDVINSFYKHYIYIISRHVQMDYYSLSLDKFILYQMNNNV